ncbi:MULTISPECIES: capsular polysaccharide biosynthesis protein [Sinorhizobium]|uniref:LpsZ n=2 Tax=Rhizobium meliloti TaxID=382 RepID=Q92VY4_RHIME|nr:MULTISPECIES: capsular polysaccharide biosynthesis protein [Sinorhizobium]AEH83818.1 LpsZ [Sinorhizobium meliloti SM11]AGG71575.1 Lipopolysaccharide processing protein (Polysaccharide chain length determinant protein),involved in capsule polysaccharide biosynthesis [Sinorhizobium meliloti 2011]ASP62134.1 beta-3-deoxy-D-manno-oct-2-ulosonic acid transferase [Sinorhizobium meliloti]ASP76250.1 beta-3-deoxy-D-manno-oct-2-ulosonic acid transferase [Sinorhizobium meliloti]ASQ07401.1 beta-3-deoxy-
MSFPPLFLFGFNKWKTFIRDWFPDHEPRFVRLKQWPFEYELYWKRLLLRDPRTRVLAWQYKGPPKLKEFCARHRIPFNYVEDGFLRSVALGALRVPPLSLAFDAQDMYFNANGPTDLEDILRTYDFESDDALMHRARATREQLLASRLSKYNSGHSLDIASIYGKKTGKRVLVIGQVERDASIAYGCSKKMTNNDLVRLASLENPAAQIIYKPHPEVLKGTAKAKSDPELVRDIALILQQDISLADALETIDHVYTITSLAGFEALLRGINVTTAGCPFYSGWGLTDDRQPNQRRNRKLTIDQIFAAAYILYPRYLDPVTKAPIEIEQALEVLARMRAEQIAA